MVAEYSSTTGWCQRKSKHGLTQQGSLEWSSAVLERAVGSSEWNHAASTLLDIWVLSCVFIWFGKVGASTPHLYRTNLRVGTTSHIDPCDGKIRDQHDRRVHWTQCSADQCICSLCTHVISDESSLRSESLMWMTCVKSIVRHMRKSIYASLKNLFMSPMETLHGRLAYETSWCALWENL